MHCPYCNQSIKENSNTCAYCGKALQTKKGHLAFYPQNKQKENALLKNSLSKTVQSSPEPTYQLKKQVHPPVAQAKTNRPIKAKQPTTPPLTAVPNRPAPIEPPVLSRPADPSAQPVYQTPVYHAPKAVKPVYIPPVSDSSPSLASPSYKMDKKDVPIFPQAVPISADAIPTYPDLLEDAPPPSSVEETVAVSPVDINKPVKQIQLDKTASAMPDNVHASTMAQVDFVPRKKAQTKQQPPLQETPVSVPLIQKEDYLEGVEADQTAAKRKETPQENVPHMTPSELDEPLLIKKDTPNIIDEIDLKSAEIVEELNNLIGQSIYKDSFATEITNKPVNKVIKYDSFADKKPVIKKTPLQADLEAEALKEDSLEEDFPTASYPVLNKVLHLNADETAENNGSKLVREPIQDYAEDYKPYAKKQPEDPFQYDSSNASDITEKPEERPKGVAPQALSYEENSFVYEQLNPVKTPLFKNRYIMIITAAIVCIITLALVITFAFSNRSAGRSSLNITGNEISGSMSVRRALTTYSNSVLTAENFVVTVKGAEIFTPDASAEDKRDRIIFTYEMKNTGKAPITPANPLATRFKLSELTNNNYVMVESTQLPDVPAFKDYKNTLSESLPVDATKTFKKCYIINEGVNSVKLSAYDEYSNVIASESFELTDIPKMS